MKYQFWPPALQEYLKETFSYDPNSGEVTRSRLNKMGPKTVGPVGTVNKNTGDLLAFIAFGSRTWSIRLAKLAVFLHTGQQYRRIDFQDDVRTNLKAENLIVIGLPLTENEESIEMTRIINESAASGHKKKQLLAKVEALVGKEETKSVEGRDPMVNPVTPEEFEKKWRRENPDYPGTYDQYWDEEHARRDKVRDEQVKKEEESPLKKALRAATNHTYERWQQERWESGLYSFDSIENGELFFAEALDKQSKTPEEMVATLNQLEEKWQDWLTQQEKWVADLYSIALWKHRLANTVDDPATYKIWFLGYRWKGQIVQGKYNQLPKEWQVTLSEELGKIEKEFKDAEQRSQVS